MPNLKRSTTPDANPKYRERTISKFERVGRFLLRLRERECEGTRQRTHKGREMNDELPKDLITISAAAKLAHGTHVATIRRWILRGKLRGYRIGGRKMLVSLADMEGMIQQVQPSEPPTYQTGKQARAHAEWADQVLKEMGVR